jgi:SGNH domain (fused to AT3 domains)
VRPFFATAFLLVLTLVAPAGGASDPPRAPAREAAIAQPRIPSSPCFGAAARDPQRRPCRDARLSRLVVPAPQTARRYPNAPCKPVERTEAMNVCGFGADPGEASETIALVGDSHASHWRAALDVVANERGWRGLSIAHTSCPLSKAVRNLEDPSRFTACIAWKQAVFAWFERHPEIHTVFVAGLSGGAGVIPPPGESRFAASVRGYRAAWRALPATVERIVVIRDTPKMPTDTPLCLERALARGRSLGAGCAVPRRAVLDRDPLVVAAAAMPRARVRTIDMTRYFCGRRECYPVIGGALVLRDVTHMTAVFSSSLGPYLADKVDRLWASWGDRLNELTAPLTRAWAAPHRPRRA